MLIFGPFTAFVSLAFLGTVKARYGDCYEAAAVRADAPIGAVAVQLRSIQLCTSLKYNCTAFHIKKLIVTFGNFSTANPTSPISACSTTPDKSVFNIFCLNATRQAILVATSIYQYRSVLLGGNFLYTVNLDGLKDCFIRVDIIDATTAAPKTTSDKKGVNSDPTRTLGSTSTPSNNTQAPVTPDVQLVSNKINAVNVSLTAMPKVQLQCSFIYRNGMKKRPSFRWEKDGRSIDMLREHIQFTQSNFTQVTGGLDVLQTQFLDLVITNPFVQGYYRCVAEADKLYLGNNTLLWLTDVSTMTWEIKASNMTQLLLQNKTILTLDEFEYIFGIKLAKSLKKNKLQRERFYLVVNRGKNDSSVTPDGSNVLLTAYYRNVTESERLGICKLTHTGKFTSHFNTTSLDCCVPSVTGKDSSSAVGEIYWPTTLHATTSEMRCPFSKRIKPSTAHRFCQTDFAKGAKWLEPETSRCPVASQMTKELKRLSEQKLNKDNKKAAANELRKLTKKANNFTNELDVGFSTDVLENVVEVPDDQNAVLQDVLGTASDLMNVASELLMEAQTTMNTSTRVLRLLEKLSDGVQVNSTITEEQDNIAFGMNNFKEETVNEGLSILGFRNETTGLPQLKFGKGQFLDEKSLLAFVYLSPASLKKMNKKGDLKTKKLTSFLFNKPVFFQETAEVLNKSAKRQLINGKIVSLMVNGRRIQNLNGEEEIQNYFRPNSSGHIECVYWNFNAKDGKGDWSTKGCTLKGLHRGLYQCSCNHMTNFAILLDVSSRPLTKLESEALSIVSYIGCIISMFGLFATTLTFSCFRNLRTTIANKILLRLSTSLMMTMVIFLVGSSINSPIGCRVISVLLHYFVLTTFCWMVVEAYNIYRSLVVVFRKESTKFLTKADICAWGFPLVIVLAASLVSQLHGYYNSTDPGQWRCMVAGLPFYLAYLTPVSLILFINFLVLIAAIVSVSRQSAYVPNKGLRKRSKAKMAVYFSVLLGCTWIFGLIAIEDLKFTFQLLFCIFNSMQGFFIFIFFCARNEDVKKEWRRVSKQCFAARTKVDEQGTVASIGSMNQTIKLDHVSSWPSQSISR